MNGAVSPKDGCQVQARAGARGRFSLPSGNVAGVQPGSTPLAPFGPGALGCIRGPLVREVLSPWGATEPRRGLDALASHSGQGQRAGFFPGGDLSEP